jgi:hypothetical protein
MDNQNPHIETIRRAALPVVLFADDLALATQLTSAEADHAARAGRFGPHFLVKGAVAVLRSDFLISLRAHGATADLARKEVSPPTGPVGLDGATRRTGRGQEVNHG